MPKDDYNNDYNKNNRDRTVPPEEDYYKYRSVDLNFNSRERDKPDEEDFIPLSSFDRSDKERNSEHNNHSENEIFSGGGINPTLDYDNEYYSEPERRPAKPPKKKKSSNGLKAATGIISVLLILVLLCVMLIEPILGKINYDERVSNEFISQSELLSSGKVKNILLLGVDARADEESEASRADSMMLITLDKNNKCIKLTSFLRDTWIYIPPADKKQRLNAACTYGGYNGVVDTIEYNFGIDIDGYVVADFEMFKVMVDSIGGVEVEVTEKEANEVTNNPGRYGNVVLDSGKYTLTGEQALAYCRIRKIDTDWKRTERQRTVIEAIIKGVISSGPIGAYKMANSVAPYIETNLSKGEIRSLALSVIPCITGGFEQSTCPADGTWEYANKGGASVITLDVDENKKILQSNIYGEESEEN